MRAKAILPPSIWHRLGDGAGPLTRYSRVFIHNWQTWRVMNHYLKENADFDAIFVPTISVHHLLAWAWLVKGILRHRRTRVLLFFVHGPLRSNLADGTVSSDGSATSRLMFRLIKWLEPEINSRKVVLGVETEAMRKGFESAAGVPFVAFPQPVSLIKSGVRQPPKNSERELVMACYGAARAEKGSDVLQKAILLHRQRHPASRTRFIVQWIEDFTVDGVSVGRSPELMADPQVKFLTRYFADGEYALWLGQTDAMLLPYRLCSYALRGSRVVIEATINGLPVIATKGTTLATLAHEHGAGLTCADGDPESLAAAIQEMELRFFELSKVAESRKTAAAACFSTATFRERFINPVSTRVSADRECALQPAESVGR